MLIAILVAFLAAAAIPLLYRLKQQLATVAAPAVALGIFVYFAAQLPTVLHGDTILLSYEWAPGLNVSASFALDGLSLAFALLVSGIGALIFTYASAYFHHERDRLGNVLAVLMMFMGSMLGVVLADDAITLFVFWELTSISSFFLIGYKSHTEKAKKSALQALVVTGAGGLVLLAGLLMLGQAAIDAGLPADQARRISALAEVDIRGHAHYTAIFILVALGAFSKSAQMPLHFWLPGAMVAPTPISAYLHSATMVKAGTYLLARLNPHLGDTELWFWTVTTVGAVTMVLGAVFAVFQRDLKRVLAYTTVSMLGTLTMLVGVGSVGALQAFALFLFVHALYKAPLFMVAGTIDHQAGTRDPWAIRGLAYRMRGTGAVIALAALSMAGIPPFFGFLAKEEMYGAALAGDTAATAVAVASWIAAAFTAAAAFVVALPTFSRGPGGPNEPPVEGPLRMVAAPAILAVLGFLFGAWSTLTEGMIGSVASAIAGEEIHTHLALWHGIKDPYGLILLMSAASLAVAGLIYAKLASKPPAAESRLGPLQASEIYGRALDGLYAFAGAAARVLQGGPLHRHMLIIVTVAIAVAATPLILFWEDVPLRFEGAYPYEVLLVALAGAGLIPVLTSSNRLIMTAGVGVTGLCIAFLFALLSGPDLAITQLMVETLMVILLVLVLHRLPKPAARHRAPRRLVHAAIAIAGGAVVTLLMLLVATPRFPADVSQYFIETTPDEKAGNIVNTILENFRALDTLGEISVLAIAGVGVAALLRLRRERDERGRDQARKEEEA